MTLSFDELKCILLPELSNTSHIRAMHRMEVSRNELASWKSRVIRDVCMDNGTSSWRFNFRAGLSLLRGTLADTVTDIESNLERVLVTYANHVTTPGYDMHKVVTYWYALDKDILAERYIVPVPLTTSQTDTAIRLLELIFRRVPSDGTLSYGDWFMSPSRDVSFAIQLAQKVPDDIPTELLDALYRRELDNLYPDYTTK